MSTDAQEAVNAHIVKAERCASTALTLPKHRDKSRTGIRTRTPRHLNRQSLAVTSELSGSALSAAMSGKLKLHTVCCRTADVLFVATSGRKTKQPTFEAARHQLLREWDYERNAADGIHPNKTTLGSNKLVHWQCQQCPKGQLHRYQMPAYNRTGSHCQGCPYCAGHQVCTCNSLQAHYPMIASEWDAARNELTPAQVTSRSVQLVWWENPKRGSWAQQVSQRTRTNPGVNPR